MKKLFFSIALALFLCLHVVDTYAQPGPPADHGQTGDESPGGGAPLASGVGFLVAMATMYGARTIFVNTRDHK